MNSKTVIHVYIVNIYEKDTLGHCCPFWDDAGLGSGICPCASPASIGLDFWFGWISTSLTSAWNLPWKANRTSRKTKRWCYGFPWALCQSKSQKRCQNLRKKTIRQPQSKLHRNVPRYRDNNRPSNRIIQLWV